MTDRQTFSPLQENIKTLEPSFETKRWMNAHKNLCLRCQKDKPIKGGSVKFFGGLKRFICVDCIQAKLSKTEGEAK